MGSLDTLSSHKTPLPQCEEKLVLFDIDGTLVDAHYETTDDRIFASIKMAKEEGWVLGLSSDTPHKSLVDWGKYFGIDGPIIAEKGALVDVRGEKITIAESPHNFIEMREQIVSSFQEKGIVVWQGNPVNFLKNKETIGQPGDLVVLINSLREQSLGCFFRTVAQNGELSIDIDVTENLAAQIRSFYPEGNVFQEDLNHSHGLIIVSHKDIDKRTGSLELQKIMQIGKFAMIGNSLADYIGDDIAIHLSVADGTPEYRNIASFVSASPITSGAVEALEALVLSKKSS